MLRFRCYIPIRLSFPIICVYFYQQYLVERHDLSTLEKTWSGWRLRRLWKKIIWIGKELTQKNSFNLQKAKKMGILNGIDNILTNVVMRFLYERRVRETLYLIIAVWINSYLSPILFRCLIWSASYVTRTSNINKYTLCMTGTINWNIDVCHIF